MSSPIAELYWLPGCSSCLRMKEFVQARGVPFVSINVVEDPEGAARLHELGALTAPVVAVGDRWVSGGDLSAVADLLGLSQCRHEPLPPAELRARYQVIMTTVTDIAHHAASVMRVFLIDYDKTAFRGTPYRMDYDTNRAPKDVARADQLIAHAVDTLMHFNRWWVESGRLDPLDRIVLTYWGEQSLHACLEREVWHTAQHTRQVEALLREAGVDVTAPLTDSDLAGLPLPERLYP
jgi:glutaredoxin